MKQPSKRKSGVTLAELCVVLAVISVCAVMVVSFSLVVSRRSAAAEARLALMEDVTSLEVVVENWVDRLALVNATFTANGSQLVATVDGVDYTCTFDGERLVGTLPDGTAMTYLPTAVTALSFSAAQKPTDRMFFCTVTYVFPYESEGDRAPYTFCVNPHVGDVVGGAQ